jgi:hypothetical protein
MRVAVVESIVAKGEVQPTSMYGGAPDGKEKTGKQESGEAGEKTVE